MNDDPSNEVDEHWCAAQRGQVLTYLSDEGFKSPAVGEWPAWHITPLVSVWAVESIERPGSVGWWAVSGDFPTDYTTCSVHCHPRQAIREIGARWRDAAANWADGKPAEGFGLRNPEQERELASSLAARAQLFLDIAADDDNWKE